MAGSINKVFILGNVGKDPEMKYTPGGLAITNFSVATSARQKKKDGSGYEDGPTQWHRCVAFDKTAETVSQYAKKGTKVHVEGSIKYGEYTKDDVKRYTTDIVVDRLTLLGGKPAEGGAAAPPAAVEEEDPFLTGVQV